MALLRQNFQISCYNQSSPKFLINLIESNRNIDKKHLWSWFRKTEEKPKHDKNSNVYYESSCRRRLPECPEHMCKLNDSSRCLEEGYGDPIGRKWYNIFHLFGPTVIKQKPSNCQFECPKQESFREYIFGPDPPLPDPLTCRRAYKIRQMCTSEDPRLDDPRYQLTKGDVLLFTEPPKPATCATSGPRPKPPPAYRPPNAVICKEVADSVAALDCYCGCRPHGQQDNCVTNLCPVHAKPFKMPYEEMRPREPPKKYFTCSAGISTEDVTRPPRSESCSCLHAAFEAKPTEFPPSCELCGFHEALERRREAVNRTQAEDACATRKISRIERLRMITNEKETMLSMAKRSVMPTSCESKCGCPGGAEDKGEKRGSLSTR